MKMLLQITDKAILTSCCFIVVIMAPAFAEPPTYDIVDLESLRPGGISFGWSINDEGQVVGVSVDDFGERRHAFLYTDGVMHDLGTLRGGNASLANDVNDFGQVTGTSDTLEFQSAFLYSDGVMEDIGNLGGPIPVSEGHGINNAGEVTGASWNPDGVRAAFLYSGGTMRSLELLPEVCEALPSVGYDINNSSQVTGFVYVLVPLGCRTTAFIYSDGEMFLIGDLLPNFSTTGYAINDSGQVVVHAVGTGEAGGYLYADRSVERIGDVIPWGINNSGWVVGQTGLGGANSRAFLYIDGETFDLNHFVTDLSGWQHLRSARDINDSGQIAGVGITASGLAHAYLLTPASVEVTIDIKPGSDRNPVNLRSRGKIPVAILFTGSFDATQVNWETVTFGPGEATEAHGRAHLKDIDGDGDLDFLLHFKTQQTGIQCSDEEVTLTGKTFNGESFTGTDAITTVKCR